METMTDAFHRNCGEILSMALSVEYNLDFFISKYFCDPKTDKDFLLRDLILIERLGFERKVQIFEGICKKAKIDEEEFKKVAKSMRYVQKIRNKVAHYEACIGGSPVGVTLQTRKREKRKEDELKPTDELIKKVDDERMSAIQGLTKIYREMSNLSNDEKRELYL